MRLELHWWKKRSIRRRLKIPLLTICGVLGIATGLVTVLVLPKAIILGAALFVVGGVLLSEGLLRVSGIEIVRELADDPDKMTNMIGTAQRRILITAGGLHPSVFAPLLPVLTEKLRRRVEVDLVCSDTLGTESRELIDRLAGYTNLRVYLYPGNPAPYGALVDGARLRLEKFHGSYDDRRENLYIVNATAAAGLFVANFERLTESRIIQ